MDIQKHVSYIAGFIQRKAKSQKLIATKKQRIAKIFHNYDNIIILITNKYKNNRLSMVRILDYFFSRNHRKILKLLITKSQFIIKILKVETIFSK